MLEGPLTPIAVGALAHVDARVVGVCHAQAEGRVGGGDQELWPTHGVAAVVAIAVGGQPACSRVQRQGTKTGYKDRGEANFLRLRQGCRRWLGRVARTRSGRNTK
jgi:hypothetical protein